MMVPLFLLLHISNSSALSHLDLNSAHVSIPACFSLEVCEDFPLP